MSAKWDSKNLKTAEQGDQSLVIDKNDVNSSKRVELSDISRIQPALNAFSTLRDYKINDIIVENNIFLFANVNIASGSAFEASEWDIVPTEIFNWTDDHNAKGFQFDFTDGGINVKATNTTRNLKTMATIDAPINDDTEAKHENLAVATQADIHIQNYFDLDSLGARINYAQANFRIKDNLAADPRGEKVLRVLDGTQAFPSDYIRMDGVTRQIILGKELTLSSLPIRNVLFNEFTDNVTPLFPAATRGIIYGQTDGDSIIPNWRSNDGALVENRIQLVPQFTIYVTSQAQLEEQFGSSIIIPDGESWVVVIAESFSLAKDFKIGNGSSLQVEASNTDSILTFTGSGALFRNEDSSNPITNFLLRNIIIVDTSGATLYDLKGTGLCEINKVFVNGAFDLGDLEFDKVSIEIFDPSGWFTGLRIKNTTKLRILSSTGTLNTPGQVGTFYSIFGTTNMDVFINDISLLNGGSIDSLIYFDSNASANSRFAIDNSLSTGADFYQTGLDTTISSVTDEGGDAEFVTTIAHSYVLEQVINLSGFSESTYNGTVVVKTVDTPTTFTTGVAFVATDTGSATPKSLDSASILVNAQNNPSVKNSMSIAEARTSGTLQVDTIQSSFVSLEDITPVAGDFVQDPTTERFSVDTTTGIITYNGLTPITALVSFECTAEQFSGTAQTVFIHLVQNSVPITKTAITIITASGGVKGIYTRGLISVDTGDTFQLELNNDTNSIDTDVKDLKVVFEKVG